MPVGTLANMATSAFVRTPPPLAERIVRHLLAFPESKAVTVLDPTAGEGDLLLPCRSFPNARLLGVEISSARAETARQRLPNAELVAAAFEGVSIPRGSISLVLANPPYFFQNGERAEYRIIADAGLLLMRGGIMVAILPARSAWDGTLINHFCKWYERVQVWKFPDRQSDEDEAGFEDFTQIVVVGVRRAEPCDLIPAEQRRLSGFRYRASAPKSSPRIRLGWERGTPPPVLPDAPIAEPYMVPASLMPTHIVVRHADEATLLSALEKSGAHLSAWWEEATTWEMERLRGQPIMPLSGEAHVAAEVLTGLLDGEIITGLGTEPHLLTAFVGHEWASMQIDDEERQKLREHGVVSVSVRQWQDKPILGVLNLTTGETCYEQGDDVFSFLSPWLGKLAARVAARRTPVYKLDPDEWEMRVLSQFGQDKQLPNATFPGLSPAQQHRVYALGRSLDLTGRAAIQGEPGVGKTRLATATAARMAYQWRHRTRAAFPGKAKRPAWIRGLRQAWLKNPTTFAMLDLEAVGEEGTGRLIAYRRQDGTLIAPEDAGPQALPVLVTTPKKVTKEYALEIRAAWQEVGAEVMLIESHRDIPVWLARCATSDAPAVVAVFPHSLTRAFGRGWKPAVLEKEILTEVKGTEPGREVRDRLKPIEDERGALVGYQWKRTGEWYTHLKIDTRFFCPDCGSIVKAIPGKLHEVEKQPALEEERIILFQKAQSPKMEKEDDRLEPVTSRTWLTLKPRWCNCRSSLSHQEQASDFEAKPRSRTPLWKDARLPAVQRRHPQMSFASWSEATSRVQQQAHSQAAQATSDKLLTLARTDEAILRRVVTAAHPGVAEMDDATFATFRPLKNAPAALTKQLQAARPALSLDPCFFLLLWPTTFPSGKKGKARECPEARSLEVVTHQCEAASEQKGKGVKSRALTRAGRLAERRAALSEERRRREEERYITVAPLPDSFSPYDYLYRFFKGCVALAIVDESHNGRGRDTDIAQAFHQAMLSSQTRMLATGTHFGGDILGFYHYWYRFHPQFWKRLGLGWNDAEKALSQYGVVQEWTKEYESEARRGSGQTNVQVSTIPAPGLSARLIPYLLEDLVYLTVLDVGAHMPARIEIPEIVSMRDAAIEDALASAAARRRQAQAHLTALKQADRNGKGEADENERTAEANRLQQEVEQEAAVKVWAEGRHLAAHYWRLVKKLEDLARQRNQAARLAKGTVPRWFAALPCDEPFEVTQTTRSDWGDVIGKQQLVSTETLAWDYLYPLEKRLIAIVERERAEGRRVMVYYEQNDIRSMARRLEWVLREYSPWTLPNTVAAEDRQQALVDAVCQRGHDVVIVPYRRVNEGLNLQSAVDTIVWFEMALNLFMLDQASRRAWRLGKREEVRIYYLAYSNTAGHRKLRKLGQQSGAAAAFAGEVARGALVEEAGADKTTLARLSSLLQVDEGEGASLILNEGKLAQEEADLRAAFARRAQELQAALKAGRTFLGGIEDTLEDRLKALLADPAFTAPVWKERPGLRPVSTLAQTGARTQQVSRKRMVDALPARLTPSAGVPLERAFTPEPVEAFIPPSATLAPIALPANVTNQVKVEFGNLTHIEAFARRRSRRVRSYERVKRPTPLVERDIAALDDLPTVGPNGQSALSNPLSLWDLLVTQAEMPAQSPRSPISFPLPSTPRQSSLW